MKKIIFLTTIGALAFASCGHDFDSSNYDEVAKNNAENIFGLIDPRQDWNMISSGSITVTADAPLEDIVKVQILTESPFLNEDVQMLNQTNAKKGDQVTLIYDAPKTSTQLVAACISSKGQYYIQVFNVGDKAVSFNSASKARRTRADEGSTSQNLPDPKDIKLDASYLSWNAKRAEAKTFKSGNITYNQWEDGSWAEDRLWLPADGSSNGWTITNGTIYRQAEPLTENESNNIKNICQTVLYKKAQNSQKDYAVNGKNNNLRLIKKSPYFYLNNNYLNTKEGEYITLTPIQTNTSEYDLNKIYYYYYKASDLEGMSSEEQVAYIKKLPKYKAINVKDAKEAGYSGNSYETFFRANEYLLPFYGDGTPSIGQTAVSAYFPAGYKIGFLNQKTKDNNNITNTTNGCTYGDGRLNKEVNHLVGHYNSAVDKSLGGNSKEGMQWDDPRIAFFAANDKVYMCFEDGADNNFCDMIIEVGGGTEVMNEEIEVKGANYTMCFEDRPVQADYDMNDVVLRCKRINETTISLSLVAAGANDEVYLYGIQNSTLLNGKEVHALFGATADKNGNRFVNTVDGATKLPVIEETITIDANMSIPQFLKDIYIRNQTANADIRYSQRNGRDPRVIIVPMDFRYPKERNSINQAYQLFLQWARDINISGNWYRFEQEKYIYGEFFGSEE